ncbi:MAG: helix-turn-helix transcriptional regulator [Desulfofustis sp.]|nr:helix-turn-helix transcriptional regulator [Desulfofustis sp.]
MNETNYPGGPEMVKIDGTRVRAIREEKGLTQLYVATAVEVTTDTVSRWENKRYPTIKKDNALKLAAALEVDLAALLDQGSDPAASPPSQSEHRPEHVPEMAPGQPNGATTGESAPPPVTGPAGRIGSLVKTAVIITSLLVISAGIALWATRSNRPVERDMSVRRIVPPHFVAGQPFPVFLQIDSPPDRAISIILRETIPPGMSLVNALPSISGQDKKDNSIKWLTKVSGTTTFSYTLRSDLSYQGTVQLGGILKVPDSKTPEIAVSGDLQTISGVHHWADTNRDNRISDEEILAVYDLIGSDQSIGVDMELIEDIWLGDGYIWQIPQQRFAVSE